MTIRFVRQFIEEHTAAQTAFVLIGLFFMIAFAYLLVMLSAKLLGIVLMLGGLWMVIYLPWQADYQKATFAGTARLIGVMLVIAGAILLFYR
jgi:hypothetical protein